MMKIWNAIKNLPVSNELKEKVRALEAKLENLENENASLREDLHQTNVKILKMTGERKAYTGDQDN